MSQPEKYRDPSEARDKCFEEREDLRARVAKLEKQVSLAQHKERMMHEEIGIAHDARQQAEARAAELENDKLMLKGQLDMSRSLVAGAKAEIAELEERIAELEEALERAHKLLEVAANEVSHYEVRDSIRRFLVRERAVLFGDRPGDRDSEASEHSEARVPEKEEE